jgi:pyridoxamine 5'-phosphate oxidase
LKYSIKSDLQEIDCFLEKQTVPFLFLSVSNSKSIADIRREYAMHQLDESQVAANPFIQFERWFDEALKAEVMEANAMHLASVSADGRPSGRMVLLKGLEDEHFIFYTNYQSQKGRELDENPACCLTFFWPELERQVRIEGLAARVETEVSDKYFHSRPRGSQIGAMASPQSAVIKNRKILETRVADLEQKFANQKELLRPRQWGGFRVKAHLIEFWQGRPSRLHDRIRYLLEETGWSLQRLAP